MSERRVEEAATTIVLSFSPADEDVADGLTEPSFRGYLRKAHAGAVSLGEEWEEFVSCGCGSRKEVTLQVISITGARAVGEATEIEYEPAE